MERRIVKDLKHMEEHLEAAKMNIQLVENFLISSIKREKESKRSDDTVTLSEGATEMTTNEENHSNTS